MIKFEKIDNVCTVILESDDKYGEYTAKIAMETPCTKQIAMGVVWGELITEIDYRFAHGDGWDFGFYDTSSDTFIPDAVLEKWKVELTRVVKEYTNKEEW